MADDFNDFDDIIDPLFRFFYDIFSLSLKDVDEDTYNKYRLSKLYALLKKLYNKLMEDKNFLRIVDLLADTEEGNIMIMHDQFTISGMRKYIKISYGWDLFEYIQIYYQVNREYTAKESHVYLNFEDNLSSYIITLEKGDRELQVHYLGRIPERVLRSIYI